MTGGGEAMLPVGELIRAVKNLSRIYNDVLEFSRSISSQKMNLSKMSLPNFLQTRCIFQVRHTSGLEAASGTDRTWHNLSFDASSR